MTEPISEDLESTGRIKTHALVFIIYAALIALVYSPVVFGGKSLNPTLYQPHGVTAEGVYGQKGRTPLNSFNVDLATPAFYEFPVNKLVGDMYRARHLPLWNPYQAGGTPLAAQYSTRAFFPYQIAEDLSPVRYWDYFMLGRLFIAGFFTYLFIVSLGAGPWSAFLGGLLYMFSGAFTWFINLEQLANTAMMIPVLLLCMEALARPAPGAQWVRAKIVLGAVVFAFTLLAGQPETALYVLALAFLYYVFRAFSAQGLARGVKVLPRLGFSFVTGLLLSSPLVLPFIELVQRGAHIHPAGGEMGIQKLTSWQALFNVITPTLSYFPANPETIKGTSLMAEVGKGFFRYLPINGVWDNIGGYTGVLPLFLILAGLFISPLRKKLPLRKELIFFFLVGAFIVLKNAGVYPFILLGKAPMFDRVWSLRWAGPVWVFGLAVAAAMGLELIVTHLERSALARERGGKGGPLPVGAVFIPTAGIIGGAYLVYSFMPSVSLYLNSATAFNDVMRPFVLPSIIGGSVLTLIVVGLAFYITYFWKNDKRNIHALILLAILELWWCVPRGYAPETLLMKWLPLAAGMAGVVFFFRQKFTFAALGLVVFFGGAYLLDTMAPHGMPAYDDAFRPAPYVSAILQDSDGARPRVAGAYGALFPNYASALGLHDIRYVNSITPLEYQAFRERYLHSQTSGELAEMSLWFSGRPERIGEEIREGRHIYRKVESPVENDFMGRERAYSFLGVKYLVFPPSGAETAADDALRAAFEEKFPLFYDKDDARVYRNPGALPRVFLVRETVTAPGWEEAQRAFMEGGFDPLEKAVLESKESGAARGGSGGKAKDEETRAGEKDLEAWNVDGGARGLAGSLAARLEGLFAGRPAYAGAESAVPYLSAAPSSGAAKPVSSGGETASPTAGGAGSIQPRASTTTQPPVSVAPPPETILKTPRGAITGPAPLASAPAEGGGTEAEKAGPSASVNPQTPQKEAARGEAKEPSTQGGTGAATLSTSGKTDLPPEQNKTVKEPSSPPMEAEKTSGAEAPSAEKESGLEQKGRGMAPEAPTEERPPLGAEVSPDVKTQEGMETQAPSPSEPPTEPTTPAQAPLPPLEAGKARITSYSPQEVVVEVNAADDSMLVLTDLYYPGWKARVNDEKAEVLRVNGLVRGVPVKAGRSTVVFYYRPLYFMAGLGLFFLGVVFSVVLVVKDIKGD